MRFLKLSGVLFWDRLVFFVDFFDEEIEILLEYSNNVILLKGMFEILEGMLKGIFIEISGVKFVKKGCKRCSKGRLYVFFSKCLLKLEKFKIYKLN